MEARRNNLVNNAVKNDAIKLSFNQISIVAPLKEPSKDDWKIITKDSQNGHQKMKRKRSLLLV